MVRILMWIVLAISVLLGGPAREAPKGTTPSEGGAVSRGTNEFAVELYKALKDRPGNVSISPASLSTALAMTYEGARGQTADEIARVLHFPPDRQALRDEFHALTLRMDGDPSRPYRLVAANSLWGQQGDPFHPEYLRRLSETYGASLHPVDFRHAAESARRAINAWVDGKTAHLIPELLGAGAVNDSTSLVLVNAVYFKASWLNPFKPNATRPADFHLDGGKSVTVPMMRQVDDFAYAEGDDVQVLQMPYKGNDLAMVVLLPRRADGLVGLERSLTAARVDGWLGGLQAREVDVSLPKFTLDYGLDAARPLADLGMPTAFTSGADFGGIGGDRFSISAVIHRVVVKVDEVGTEAAAATAVVMPRAAALPTTPPVVFRADHPFLYLIRDLKTGAILFLGRVADPSK